MMAIPPYLFRTASDESRGLNTANEIDPLHGYDSQYHSDIASIGLPDIRFMIKDHLDWKYHLLSEFSSWSVSLLWVLVHAVRKAYAEGEDDILVYVMDTSKLPASNSLHSAQQLIKEHDLRWSTNLYEYAEGEYLIHGRICNSDGLWQAVGLDELIRQDLWKLCKALRLEVDDPRRDELHQRVIKLRSGLFGPPTPYWESLDWVIAIVKKLAASFGPQWQSIMTLAMLTIRRRNLSSDGDCLTALREEIRCGHLQVPQLPPNDSLSKIKVTWPKLQDGAHVIALLQLLQDG